MEQRLVDYKLDEDLKKQLQTKTEVIIEAAGQTIAGVMEKEVKSKVGTEATRVLNESLGKKVEELRNLDLAKTILPPGTILAWAGDGNVPPGWVVCDGNNGTPDLVNRFIMGTTIASGDVRTTGGSPTHSHNARFTGSRFEAANVGSNGTGATRHDDNRIIVSEAQNIPPYAKLIYIMKQW